ncbi:hypothetical protein HYH03_017182 [Edaphochlamys debaryana]|uniref:Uncharacterized protein n=1 Tax=Edaphochlamys debaryana TaxID=47281 RepID=A0A836BP68_9CHLO|nr:hypothetical protein HYH03_017182 [Edaphochlamys debaryana]|eukprot:KAG2484016.1 hypothetical protein HYH03_017182 [Edaphochlamys debaryana]
MSLRATAEPEEDVLQFPFFVADVIKHPPSAASKRLAQKQANRKKGLFSCFAPGRDVVELSPSPPKPERPEQELQLSTSSLLHRRLDTIREIPLSAIQRAESKVIQVILSLKDRAEPYVLRGLKQPQEFIDTLVQRVKEAQGGGRDEAQAAGSPHPANGVTNHQDEDEAPKPHAARVLFAESGSPPQPHAERATRSSGGGSNMTLLSPFAHSPACQFAIDDAVPYGIDQVTSASPDEIQVGDHAAGYAGRRGGGSPSSPQPASTARAPPSPPTGTSTPRATLQSPTSPAKARASEGGTGSGLRSGLKSRRSGAGAGPPPPPPQPTDSFIDTRGSHTILLAESTVSPMTSGGPSSILPREQLSSELGSGRKKSGSTRKGKDKRKSRRSTAENDEEEGVASPSGSGLAAAPAATASSPAASSAPPPASGQRGSAPTHRLSAEPGRQGLGAGRLPHRRPSDPDNPPHGDRTSDPHASDDIRTPPLLSRRGSEANLSARLSREPGSAVAAVAAPLTVVGLSVRAAVAMVLAAVARKAAHAASEHGMLAAASGEEEGEEGQERAEGGVEGSPAGGWGDRDVELEVSDTEPEPEAEAEGVEDEAHVDFSRAQPAASSAASAAQPQAEPWSGSPGVAVVHGGELRPPPAHSPPPSHGGAQASSAGGTPDWAMALRAALERSGKGSQPQQRSQPPPPASRSPPPPLPAAAQAAPAVPQQASAPGPQPWQQPVKPMPWLQPGWQAPAWQPPSSSSQPDSQVQAQAQSQGQQRDWQQYGAPQAAAQHTVRQLSFGETPASVASSRDSPAAFAAVPSHGLTPSPGSPGRHPHSPSRAGASAAGSVAGGSIGGGARDSAGGSVGSPASQYHDAGLGAALAIASGAWSPRRQWQQRHTEPSAPPSYRQQQPQPDLHPTPHSYQTLAASQPASTAAPQRRRPVLSESPVDVIFSVAPTVPLPAADPHHATSVTQGSALRGVDAGSDPEHDLLGGLVDSSGAAWDVALPPPPPAQPRLATRDSEVQTEAEPGLLTVHALAALGFGGANGGVHEGPAPRAAEDVAVQTDLMGPWAAVAAAAAAAAVPESCAEAFSPRHGAGGSPRLGLSGLLSASSDGAASSASSGLYSPLASASVAGTPREPPPDLGLLTEPTLRPSLDGGAGPLPPSGSASSTTSAASPAAADAGPSPSLSGSKSAADSRQHLLTPGVDLSAPLAFGADGRISSMSTDPFGLSVSSAEPLESSLQDLPSLGVGEDGVWLLGDEVGTGSRGAVHASSGLGSGGYGIVEGQGEVEGEGSPTRRRRLLLDSAGGTSSTGGGGASRSRRSSSGSNGRPGSFGFGVHRRGSRFDSGASANQLLAPFATAAAAASASAAAGAVAGGDEDDDGEVRDEDDTAAFSSSGWAVQPSHVGAVGSPGAEHGGDVDLLGSPRSPPGVSSVGAVGGAAAAGGADLAALSPGVAASPGLSDVSSMYGLYGSGNPYDSPYYGANGDGNPFAASYGMNGGNPFAGPFDSPSSTGPFASRQPFALEEGGGSGGQPSLAIDGVGSLRQPAPYSLPLTGDDLFHNPLYVTPSKDRRRGGDANRASSRTLSSDGGSINLPLAPYGSGTESPAPYGGPNGTGTDDDALSYSSSLGPAGYAASHRSVGVEAEALRGAPVAAAGLTTAAAAAAAAGGVTAGLDGGRLRRSDSSDAESTGSTGGPERPPTAAHAGPKRARRLLTDPADDFEAGDDADSDTDIDSSSSPSGHPILRSAAPEDGYPAAPAAATPTWPTTRPGAGPRAPSPGHGEPETQPDDVDFLTPQPQPRPAGAAASRGGGLQVQGAKHQQQQLQQPRATPHAKQQQGQGQQHVMASPLMVLNPMYASPSSQPSGRGSRSSYSQGSPSKEQAAAAAALLRQANQAVDGAREAMRAGDTEWLGRVNATLAAVQSALDALRAF